MFNLLLLIIYLAFISLGLPDGLLGSAWPTVYPLLNVPVSYAGIISMIIAGGTVVSSLNSDALTKKLGTGKVTLLSVAMTAAALFGFSISSSFWMLCLWAIPYGLGAGSVDASLNNYVALHYSSRSMSWLHCMWGIGASVGPNIMGYALTGNLGWNAGYRIVAIIQTVLTMILLFSLPLWKERSGAQADGKSESGRVMKLRELVRIPGVKEVMLTFFCYCAVEQTAGLWGSSYLVLHCGVDGTAAASYAAMFFIGITVGRAISGFLTMLLSDKNMVRLGEGIILIGLLAFALPNGKVFAPIGLVIVGLGCAPIYPSIIHSTPEHFGKNRSQAIIGVQMASAYVGTSLMPPLFGLIAQHVAISLFPVYLAALLAVSALMHEMLVKKAVGEDSGE